MSKSDTILQLKQAKVVAVLRGEHFDEGMNAAIACIKGGIDCIEIAYTNPFASDIIRHLNQHYQDSPSICIGAGTVLDSETAKSAIASGAKFIVSPSFNAQTATLCNRYAIPYLPGCMTVTEMVTALEAGCEIMKLFPGNALNETIISSVKAPLPQLTLMVTGGVSLDNAKKCLLKGADMIGIGGEFNKLASKKEFEQITAIAKQYKELLR
ncbi:bifunctional 2-keto-4-hydroxyglutarate aldolase/2-keto-3-deoxy-6-phosphogluconate aldolase [Streptococcus merionis]|uniref:bifunctional 2-keto-4-hydroxyglutarate aldolase/2-keto-3-deoxy-6-phosphogluconate aldolase n=1 Tax=Streptococcus merionis TaxID=400065 RepID=UPI0026ED6452|nr:bifunctional 2-keto-4-hydroxyglutarate aldolase/2-keto-3-deoxy-6-phosphogluconate aldolase [Streptococcus merionis]